MSHLWRGRPFVVRDADPLDPQPETNHGRTRRGRKWSDPPQQSVRTVEQLLPVADRTPTA